MELHRKLLAASWRSWVAPDVQRVGPYWLQLVWTFIFSAALALFFTLLGFAFAARGAKGLGSVVFWLQWLGKNLVTCLIVGYTIHALFELALRLLGRARLRLLKGWRATVFYAGVPLLGVAIGWPLGVWVALGHVPTWLLGSRGGLMGALTTALLISLALHYYFAAKAQQFEAERRASEAQLRLLQAQMEPHFLFNTLANVQSLIDREPAQAKEMLEAFTDYLRATLTQLRQADSTVAAELALAQAYLNLLATRMHGRLHFSIHADDAATQAVLPPLLLQPLVENALHHGLESKVEGGSIHIKATVSGRLLTLEVRDDGLGLHAPSRRRMREGAGVALDNLRQRLQSRYGDSAAFTLSDAAPGTLARITLPLETAEP